MSSITPDFVRGPQRGTNARRFDLFDTGDERPRGTRHEINIGSTERAVTSLLGGALVATGVACAWRGTHRPSTWLAGLAMAGAGGALMYRGATGYCGVSRSLDVTDRDADADADAAAAPWNRAIHVHHSVTIQKPADELYRFWRDFSNLPQVMEHLERVEDLGDGLSRWTAKAPPVPALGKGADGNVQWTARITEDRPDGLIAWTTEEGEGVAHAGRVEFRSAGSGRGTVVRATFDYQPIGGALGALVAKIFGEEPGQQVQEDLRRFKAHMEAGEFPTIQGQPRGECS